jgi:protein subunit release factor A
MIGIELKENDLQTEIFLNREPQTVEELVAMLTEGPIRVTHLPTGISAIGEGQGSQVKNKERAIELLKVLLAREDHSTD